MYITLHQAIRDTREKKQNGRDRERKERDMDEVMRIEGKFGIRLR